MTADSQQTNKPDRRNFVLFSLALLVVGGLTVLFARLWRLRARQQARPDGKLRMPVITEATGLSEAEAEARRQPDQDNVITHHPRRTRRQIIRASTLTIFNLNLIALALVQFLMGTVWGALITLGVLLLNVGLNVFQEEFARYRLRDLLAAARPQATVIREGKVRSIDPSEIVVGDVLAGGPGDQIMVDGVIVGEGEIVVEERRYGAEPCRLRKREGDALYAGSICTSGHATYQVEAVGEARQIVQQMQETEAAAIKNTPIEKILGHVMRILLLVVLLLGALLLLRYYRLDAQAFSEQYVDAASVIFNVAPASLFFMVVLTYVAATADLGKIGALVQDSRSVESLAHVDTVCFAKEGILTGTQVEFKASEETAGAPPLAESRIRQILGFCAHSGSANNPIVKALAATFGGDRREVVEEATFLSLYGWSALVFDDEDLRGVYALAVPEVLEARQAQEEQKGDEDEKESVVRRGAASLVRPFGRLLGRGKEEEQEDEEQELEVDALAAEPEEEKDHEKAETSGGLFGRVRHSMSSLIQRREAQPEEQEEEEELPDDSLHLTFAYSPEVSALYNAAGEPRLPSDLVLLGHLIFEERVHPDAVPALRQFADREVSTNIFTPGAAQKTVDMLLEAGLEEAADDQVPTISGPELASLDTSELTQAALDNRVFGQVSPRQTEQIVRVLHEAQRAVGVVADSAGDVSSLRQGDLAITRGSSSPAALSQADIILIGDSPAVLSRVVDKGQRIVNGLLDVLKLYLTQSFYLLALLILIPLFIGGFPYTSAQGGMIAIFTLTLPAVGLSLWAPAGQFRTSTLGQVLARFVVPASVTMAAAGVIIYTYFLELSGEVQYAQIALTHMLVAIGLLLVLFIQPPVIFSWGNKPALGNLPVTVIVVISAVLFFLATQIPFTQELLQLDPLQGPSHYLIIIVAALVWALILRIIWFIIPVERPVLGSLFEQ
ncbi:MAG: hypothetical protein GWP61_10885 [Chloroflexi bacterium]|jgi:magnesium-transporting ATPase (P-type)|nr:hypothetical protein [Chloroflexota bacterium]